jgi:putative sterol carrier protein
MALDFPSDEWIKALCEELNHSNGYRAAAKKWEGDLIFVVKKGGTMDRDRFLYMDLWHGECRGAFELASLDEKDAAFRLEAPLATWQELIGGNLDPIKAIIGRKVALTGPMTKILKAPKAALELVKSAGQLETNYPV